ncbi:hypothetical protein PQI23_00785 [Leucobacter sp. USCH14]|uniref:hypothetical protein n=1 Tax=Leucobacter sp. USCH14 TaxID=3024838 RepID=UPI0030AAE813
MTTDPTRPEPLSSQSPRPEPGEEETTTRIPLTPPPPGDGAADPAPNAPSAHVDAASASDLGAPHMRDSRTAGEASAGRRDTDRPFVDERSRSEQLPTRPSPRTGPIVWGALILVFCGYVSQQVLGGGGLDAAGWITATVIGLGVLLLGVGFAVLMRSRRETKRKP